MNTVGFKHFKLYSDSTLKSLTKDDLIRCIHIIYNNWQGTDKCCFNVIEYAKKLQKELELTDKQLEELKSIGDIEDIIELVKKAIEVENRFELPFDEIIDWLYKNTPKE